jgi:hypothetical protein
MLEIMISKEKKEGSSEKNPTPRNEGLLDDIEDMPKDEVERKDGLGEMTTKEQKNMPQSMVDEMAASCGGKKHGGDNKDSFIQFLEGLIGMLK